MVRKLQCAIVDDDPDAHTVIKNHLTNYNLAEIKYSFYSPSEFLKKLNFIDFDLCFLDCLFYNDRIQGTDLAFKLKELNKHFIFISSNHQSFIEACRMVGALDAIPKPNTEKRIKESIEYAYKIIFPSIARSHKEHELCYVAEHKGKISIPIPNIVYAKTDEFDPRNKIAHLKNNISYTLMDYKFSRLLQLSTNLALVNRSEVISYDVVEEVKGDCIYIRQNENKELPRIVTLSKTCRKNFNQNFH